MSKRDIKGKFWLVPLLGVFAVIALSVYLFDGKAALLVSVAYFLGSLVPSVRGKRE